MKVIQVVNTIWKGQIANIIFAILAGPSAKHPKKPIEITIKLEDEQKRDGSSGPKKRKSRRSIKSNNKSTGHHNQLVPQIRNSRLLRPPTQGKPKVSIESIKNRQGSDQSRRDRRKSSKKSKTFPCKCCQLAKENRCVIFIRKRFLRLQKKLAESEKFNCALFVIVIILVFIGIVCLITFPILAATGYFHSVHHHKF
jgi:hypothetical protein